MRDRSGFRESKPIVHPLMRANCEPSSGREKSLNQCPGVTSIIIEPAMACTSADGNGSGGSQ